MNAGGSMVEGSWFLHAVEVGLPLTQTTEDLIRICGHRREAIPGSVTILDPCHIVARSEDAFVMKTFLDRGAEFLKLGLLSGMATISSVHLLGNPQDWNHSAACTGFPGGPVVSYSGKFHGQRSHGVAEPDTTEAT